MTAAGRLTRRRGATPTRSSIRNRFGFSDYRHRSVDFWRRVPSLERAAVRKKTVTTLSRLMSLQQRSAIARRGNDGRLQWQSASMPTEVARGFATTLRTSEDLILDEDLNVGLFSPNVVDPTDIKAVEVFNDWLPQLQMRVHLTPEGIKDDRAQQEIEDRQ